MQISGKILTRRLFVVYRTVCLVRGSSISKRGLITWSGQDGESSSNDQLSKVLGRCLGSFFIFTREQLFFYVPSTCLEVLKFDRRAQPSLLDIRMLLNLAEVGSFSHFFSHLNTQIHFISPFCRLLNYFTSSGSFECSFLEGGHHTQ